MRRVCILLLIIRVLQYGIQNVELHSGKVITKPYKTRLLRFELNLQVIGLMVAMKTACADVAPNEGLVKWNY
jgi:hypothetical protein